MQNTRLHRWEAQKTANSPKKHKINWGVEIHMQAEVNNNLSYSYYLRF